MLHSIEEALDFIEGDIIGGKSWITALAHPRHRLPFISLRTKRVIACANLTFARYGSHYRFIYDFNFVIFI